MIGQFTKEEAQVVEEAVDEMFNALSKAKRMEYLGHLNEILCFVGAAKQAAPTEAERDAQEEETP